MKPVFTDAAPDSFEFRVYHHTAKKNVTAVQQDFSAKIEQTEKGSVIKGSFRKPVYTYVIAVLWTVITLFMSLYAFCHRRKNRIIMYARGFYLRIFIMFWDNKNHCLKPILTAFQKHRGTGIIADI